ncbi:hypothetical protein OEZ85_008383 [Tetradesmus obliquus]|uniref:Uncharacterized protein n=1 Tax=Tetradesmus obliquus TaxID=3088 RepID=A0ABY8TIP5_TETOB|nr:hypothetical protein OEZ85_008383 [Tetradesmus obliquus]
MSKSALQLLSCQAALRALGCSSAAAQQTQWPSLALLSQLGQQATRNALTVSHTHIPKAKHDPYRTPPKNYVQLLQHITRARELGRLEQLVKQYGPKFDGVHVAAAMSMLPKLHQPARPGSRLRGQKLRQRRQIPAKLLGQLQDMAAAQVPRLFAREVASITWALGRCRSLLPQGSSSRGKPSSKSSKSSKSSSSTGLDAGTKQLVGQLMQRLRHGGGRLLYQGANGADVAKVLHGLARLGLGPVQHSSVKELCMFVQRHPERMHAKELAAAAWALAKMRGQAQDAVVRRALSVISKQAVQRSVWLRPVSICSLATAWAQLGRGDDTALLGALAEEAVAQIKAFQPQQLAVLAWAFGRLSYNPGEEALAALSAAALRHLEGFDAQHLGMLLRGLTLLQGSSMDTQLLSAVAAGIAKEEAVALNARDAVRILAAFVAAPEAGHARDVSRMAERIGDALQGRVGSIQPAEATNMLVCYSKLPAQHELLLRLARSAAARASDFSMGKWVRLLQSCKRLGYSRLQDARLVDFYAAADTRLQQHLLGAVVPAAAAAAAAAGSSSAAQQQQGEQQDAAQQPAKHALQFTPALDIAELLGQRGSLSEQSAMYLADAGAKLVTSMSLRRLAQLLTAVMLSGDRMAAIEEVRQLLVVAAQRLQGENLASGGQPLGVLVGLAWPLGRAVSRNMLLGQGEALLRGVYAGVLPQLAQCDEQQLVALVECMQRSGVSDDALQAAAEDMAGQRGWRLPAGQPLHWLTQLKQPIGGKRTQGDLGLLVPALS